MFFPAQISDLPLCITGRLDQFESRISEVLFEHRIDDKEHVQLELWSSPGKEKVSLLALQQLVSAVMLTLEMGLL